MEGVPEVAGRASSAKGSVAWEPYSPQAEAAHDVSCLSLSGRCPRRAPWAEMRGEPLADQCREKAATYFVLLSHLPYVRGG